MKNLSRWKLSKQRDGSLVSIVASQLGSQLEHVEFVSSPLLLWVFTQHPNCVYQVNISVTAALLPSSSNANF